MESKGIPYIPAAYVGVESHGITIWHASDEDASHCVSLTGLAEQALAFLDSTVGVRTTRCLHLCCYRSNTEACASLGRTVPPTMALAPFADRDRGLVVVQSSSVAPENADPARMLRILVHEFAHLLTMEITGSRKRLGDANLEMRIPAWLHEGIAEVCGLLAVGRDRSLARCLCAVTRTAESWSFEEVSAKLDDLGGRERAAAFARATGAVAWLAGWVGLARIVGDLPRWIRALPSDL